MCRIIDFIHALILLVILKKENNVNALCKVTRQNWEKYLTKKKKLD